MARWFRPVLLTACALALTPPGDAQPPEPAQPASAQPTYLVEPIAERTVTELPEGPLYWRVETFPSLAAAEAGAGPWSLAAEHAGRAWRFTLGPAGAAGTPGEAGRGHAGTPNTVSPDGGALVAEIGPVPAVPAARWTLRVNRAGGPPGARTQVHSHPGSEAFYVLAGEMTLRTPHGETRLGAGEAMAGHGADVAMQASSCGAGALDQLVMFVVDADRPFSSPAAFE